MNGSLSSDDNSVAYCEWYLYVHNCHNSQYFIATYWASAAVSAVSGLTALGLLVWRVRRRSKLSWNESGVLVPLEGFLCFLVLCLLSRIATSIILNVDLWPKNYILRELVSDFQWIFALLCIATYLAGVFHAIPRMSFHQPSNHRHSSALCIPSAGTTRIVYWTYVVLHFVIAETSAALSGYFRTKGNDELFRVFFMTRMFSYTVSCVCISIAFVVYGRLLVRLTKESFKLVRDRGGTSRGNGHTVLTECLGGEEDCIGLPPRIDSNVSATRGTGERRANSNKKFKYHLRKMRFFNVCCIMLFTYFAVTSAGGAIWPDTLWSTMALSEIHAFIANISMPGIALAVLMAILLSELSATVNSPDGDQGRRGIRDGLPGSVP